MANGVPPRRTIRARQMACWLGMALVGLTSVRAASGQRFVGGEAEACGCSARPAVPAAWSEPVLVSGIPAGRSIRWPSVSVRRDTAYVAANVFPIAPGVPVDSRPLVILRLPGEPVAPPPGSFQFAFPRGLHDGRGRYHLFWAEPRDPHPAAESWPRLPLVTLLHAVFRDGAWSRPDTLLSGGEVMWGAEAGTVAVDGADRLHVVLPASGRSPVPGLTHLRRAGLRWERREIPAQPAYASVAAWGADSLAIAFTAPDASVARDGNSVFVSTSSDGGESWSAPRLLSRSGDRAASRPGLVHAREGALHLVWTQDVTGGGQPESLRHRRSVDGGLTWEGMPASPLPAGALAVQTVRDPCGGIVTLVESFDGRLRLHEVGWSEPVPGLRRLLPGEAMAGAGGLSTRDGTLLLVSAVQRRAGEPAVTMAAERTLCPPGSFAAR